MLRLTGWRVLLCCDHRIGFLSFSSSIILQFLLKVCIHILWSCVYLTVKLSHILSNTFPRYYNNFYHNELPWFKRFSIPMLVSTRISNHSVSREPQPMFLWTTQNENPPCWQTKTENYSHHYWPPAPFEKPSITSAFMPDCTKLLRYYKWTFFSRCKLWSPTSEI